MAAKTLESIAVGSRRADSGVQREALEVGAQLPRCWLGADLASTDVRDPGAGLVAGGNAALRRLPRDPRIARDPEHIGALLIGHALATLLRNRLPLENRKPVSKLIREFSSAERRWFAGLFGDR